MGASRISPAPPKDDGRFDDWLTKLWQIVSPFAGTFSSITTTAAIGVGTTPPAGLNPAASVVTAGDVQMTLPGSFVRWNQYFASAAQHYYGNGFAGLFGLNASSGDFEWYTSPSNAGGAGATATITNRLSLSSVGVLTGHGAVLSDNATGGVGYAAGAGGTITQLTSKSTGVTLNKVSGQITTVSAALASAAKVTFTVTNSACAAADIPVVVVVKGGTANAYRASVAAVAAGSFAITLENITAGSLTEQPVIGFTIFKGAIA